jgi:spore coat protein SA
MKVALVSQPLDGVLPPHQNSIGIWTYKVAPHLAKVHEVIVYARQTRLQKDSGELEGVKYVFIPSLPNRVNDRLAKLVARRPDPKKPVVAADYFYLDYILPVALDIRRKGIEIVHIHNFTQFAPIVKAFNPNVKLVMHMNCEWLSQLDLGWVERRMRSTDLVLGSSNYIAEKVRQRLPQYAQICQAVYNGVDPDLFNSSTASNEKETENQEQRVLFVGRVSPEKGVHILIEAFQKVVACFPQAHLDIVGPVGALPLEFIVGLSDDPKVAGLAELYHEEYGLLLQRLASGPLAERVHFWGGMPQDGIRQHYQAATVLVNPSFSESFGMSLVEAMASCKPVIASRVGGMVEVVDEGKTGFLVESGDVEGLAQAICQVLENPEEAKCMGTAGRQRVLDYFSWAQIAQNLVLAYQGLDENLPQPVAAEPI